MRGFLLLTGAVTAFALACGGTETVVVKETVVVERPVEKVVQQTVVVEKPVEVTKVVEKQVQQTVVVEKMVLVEKKVEVQVTPTPVQTFFGLPLPVPVTVTGTTPAPKTPNTTIVERVGAELRTCGLPGGQSCGRSFGVTEKFWTTNKSGDAVNLLAESWVLASDLKGLKVTVKKGVQFHGGFGELTASDVAWSLNQGNPGFNKESVTDGGSNWVTLIGNNEVTVVDPYTVNIPISNFDVRWQVFHFGQSGLGLAIHTKKAFDQLGRDKLLNQVFGTGPYEVTKFAQDDVLEMKRFGQYHGARAEPELWIQRSVPDDAVAEALLKTGDVDISEIPLRNIPMFQALGFKVVGAGAGSFHSISLSGNYWETTSLKDGAKLERLTYANHQPWIGDPTRATFGNPPAGMDSMERARLVRHALAKAIDRKTIAKVLFADAGWPNHVYGHDINNPNYQAKWNYDYDKKAAGELLDRAGYPLKGSTRFAMPFFIRLGRGDEEIGTAVAGMWREIGIDVQEFRADYTVFRPSLIGRSATQPWIHSAGAESPQAPWDWPVIGASESTLGRPGFNVGIESDFYGKKFQEMSAEPDKNKRITIRNEVAEYTHRWALIIGTVSVPNVALINPKKVASWDMPLNTREACCHHPELLKVTK